MFRTIYWLAAIAFLFFLPGLSLVMLLLWICKIGFAPFLSLFREKSALPGDAGGGGLPQRVANPDHSRQEAAEFEEEARTLAEESKEDKLLMQNAVRHHDPVDEVSVNQEPEGSLQDRLEAEYRS